MKVKFTITIFFIIGLSFFIIASSCGKSKGSTKTNKKKALMLKSTGSGKFWHEKNILYKQYGVSSQ